MDREKMIKQVYVELEGLEDSVKYQFETLGEILGSLNKISYLLYLAQKVDENK